MKRRTLDILFSVGGTALAVLLAVLGFVLKANANFAHDYVREQMQQQHITFTPEEGLSPEEREAECLIEHAGKPLETGRQAECYANEYIGLHLAQINGGKTYSQTSGEARAARAGIDKVANQLRLDLKTASIKAGEAWERMETANKCTESAEEALRITRERYQSGAADIPELLTAQSGLTGTRTRNISALYDYLTALSNLERARGALVQRHVDEFKKERH